MRWIEEGSEIDDYNRYQLSTGRRFYANSGILGLGPEDDALVSHGYDGSLESGPDCDRAPFTPAERLEIAEEMIRGWKKWGGIQNAR